MKKSDLLEDLKDVPDDAEIVIGKCFVLNEEDKITAILDIPIVGTALNSNENELRFMLTLDDVKQCFHPENVKLFEKA